MAEKAIRSQGTVLYYNVGGSPTAWTALGKVVGISGPNAQADEIDQTDLDDTQFHRKMAGARCDSELTSPAFTCPAILR